MAYPDHTPPEGSEKTEKIDKEETNPMRNLKKFLALVLAMVMAFSLMLTANAANTAKDFDDNANITEAFVEAADVLTGMKVFQGDEEAATFRPADQINRAEVAALIYRLATGDVDDVRSGAYANYGNFADVSESDWFAGYVGYCANAGYIKGHNGYFNPYDSVTGYETLAMILRAIGYDKNHEFEGATWETNVSALATQLGILTNIKTTHYGNTLYLASRRDVVAELLFQADAKVPMVVYTPAFGYQQTGMSGGVVGTTTNPTLGKHIFGLTLKEDGILLGNEQTGEGKDKSVLGYAGTVSTDSTGAAIKPYGYSAYAYNGTYAVADIEKVDSTQPGGYATAAPGNIKVTGNIKYELKTGIDLIGHELKVWYDDGTGAVSNSNKHVYAYFDKAELTDVVILDTGDTTVIDTPNTSTTLGADAKKAGFKVTTSTTAVFNNSFSRFGENDNYGNGVAQDGSTKITASPVRAYKLISNSSDKSLDAVIALNIESSRITESNNVNRVPTIGVPVTNSGTVDTVGQTEDKFIHTSNVHTVNTVATGVMAQDALVGNSAKTLGDYEFGIHVTGTTQRTVSSAETTAINGTGTEACYFLLNKVTATKEGTVVAYNVNAGTVTLDDGTVLERSKYYHTVVGWSNTTPSNSPAPASVIPQGWVQGGTNWEEGYANVTYKFYTDYEGKYLGAERSYGSTFLYGTYLDYDQKVSTSSFNYYLTGVNMNGEIETVPVSRYWNTGTANPGATQTAVVAGQTAVNITGTGDLDVPFRDATAGGTGVTNGIGLGVYAGFAIQGNTVDGYNADVGANRNEYLSNMARLGIKWGDANINADTSINNASITLGAQQIGGTGKYFTEATKFILVSGYGTDSVRAEVYNGISELRGTSSIVTLNLADGKNSGGSSSSNRIQDNTDYNTMTYYKESPYTYAQSGQTSMQIDTIILPKAAVTRSGGSGLYYVGNPTPTLINSYGADAWKYDLYVDGELQQIWLTNNPSQTATNRTDSQLTKDTFLHLRQTSFTANDGEPIYTAGNYNATTGVWTAGTYITSKATPNAAWVATEEYTLDPVLYSAVTRDAQTATFMDLSAANGTLLRVADAKVVNLNLGAKSNTTTLGDVDKCKSGEIWPGITDLTTLNEAGSINPVTSRALKVAAVVDPDNPLVVTCIYVCWDQAIS